MEYRTEQDPELRFVDALLADLSVRTEMHVGRRTDGDARTFVIQTGEEGRFRLGLPDLASATATEAVVREVQVHLAAVLRAPVPLCPLHKHALVGVAGDNGVVWVCPDGEWQCDLGDYEEQTWPQLDASLAPILLRRLQRRGPFPTVRTINVCGSGEERIADFGLVQTTPELRQALAEVAAPLPIRTHTSPNDILRPLRLSD